MEGEVRGREVNMEGEREGKEIICQDLGKSVKEGNRNVMVEVKGRGKAGRGEMLQDFGNTGERDKEGREKKVLRRNKKR